MPELSAYFWTLPALLALATLAWLLSLVRRDAGVVDSFWSLFFLTAALLYSSLNGAGSGREWIVLALTAIWALRLSLYITLRNRGQGEDSRYQEIRARNEPHFAFKSLYLVFWLQAVLAWLVSLPLLAAIYSDNPLNALDFLGIALWLLGFGFEAIGDYQLYRFKADPANRGKVLDTGLWRLSRHPNYFGNACLWWGFFLIALAGGGWWSLPGPLLMTFLLLKVSGVALLESSITERRPEYADYMRRTNAFIPGLPKKT